MSTWAYPASRRGGDTIPVVTSSAQRFRRRVAGTPDWAVTLGVYLLIRAIGVAMLARFAAAHDRAFDSALQVWDGRWMLAIATYGYDAVPETQRDGFGIHTDLTAYAFFPGYPYLVRALAQFPLVTPFGAAITVSLVAGCVAALGVARIGALSAERMTGSRLGTADPRRVGLVLVALFAATPMSVVLNMAYTEALFCALAAWALVGVLQRQWLLAGVCSMFAGLVRPTAVALIAVVVIAGLLAVRTDRWRAVAGILLSPLGFLAYLGVVWAKSGSPTGWFQIQTEGWDTGFDFGAATLRFLDHTLLNSREFSAVAVAWVILATLVLAVWAAWAPLPWPLLLYALGVLATVLLSDGLMISRARLLLPAFVLLIPAAIVIARWRPGGSIAALTPIVAVCAWFGAYVATVYPYAM